CRDISPRNSWISGGRKITLTGSHLEFVEGVIHSRAPQEVQPPTDRNHQNLTFKSPAATNPSRVSSSSLLLKVANETLICSTNLIYHPDPEFTSFTSTQRGDHVQITIQRKADKLEITPAELSVWGEQEEKRYPCIMEDKDPGEEFNFYSCEIQSPPSAQFQTLMIKYGDKTVLLAPPVLMPPVIVILRFMLIPCVIAAFGQMVLLLGLLLILCGAPSLCLEEDTSFLLDGDIRHLAVDSNTVYIATEEKLYQLNHDLTPVHSLTLRGVLHPDTEDFYRVPAAADWNATFRVNVLLPFEKNQSVISCGVIDGACGYCEILDLNNISNILHKENFQKDYQRMLGRQLQPKVLLRQSNMTSVLAVRQNSWMVFFIGTGDGQLIKLAVDRNYHTACPRVLYRSNHYRRVFPRMHLDPVDHKHVYVPFQNEVKRVAVAKCSTHTNVQEWWTAQDPYCVWCVSKGSCTFEDDCEDSHWLSIPDVFQQKLISHKVVEDGTGQLTLNIQTHVSVSKETRFACQFSTTSGELCSRDGLPPQFPQCTCTLSKQNVPPEE
ncbi:uncharacterized protein LOC115404655, partial [Salarias fasciatus]|uniref:uncharacterized protein LOC115404655 n=1 Tax=Salarias fasciatus TaxID=181472 RepID=UPI0011770CCC